MPLFYLSVAYLLGVALAPNSPWPALVWLLAAAAAILLTLPAYRLGLRTGDVSRRFPRGLKPHALRLLGWARLSRRAFSPALLLALPFLAAASLALGAARAKAGLPDLGAPGHISAYNDDGRTYTLTGLLIAPPDARDSYTNLRLAVESIRPRDGIMHQAVSGILLVRVKPDDTWRYGDRLVVTGKIETPPEAEGFSYRDYLARRGVYSLISFGEAAVMERGGGNPLLAGIYALRGRAHETLHRLYPDPAASLLAGILLGLDNGLPAELQQAFRDTGTAHIIAISGFNITILSAVVLSALGRLFGRRAGGWLAGLAIGAYTILVGADPAVVRAAIMGLGAILLRDARRPGAALNMLALTAALMALANPGVLGDAGFQLSFAATLGLVRFSDPLARGFGRAASRYLRISTVQRITPVVTDAVLLSLAAQIATLPVSLVHFGRISLSSLLVNPLILPVQPAVMILGGISLVAGLAWPPLGELMALPVYPFVAYTLRLVEIFGALPGGVWAPGRPRRQTADHVPGGRARGRDPDPGAERGLCAGGRRAIGLPALRPARPPAASGRADPGLAGGRPGGGRAAGRPAIVAAALSARCRAVVGPAERLAQRPQVAGSADRARHSDTCCRKRACPRPGRRSAAGSGLGGKWGHGAGAGLEKFPGAAASRAEPGITGAGVRAGQPAAAGRPGSRRPQPAGLGPRAGTPGDSPQCAGRQS